MKRIVIIAVLLAFSVGISVYSTMYVNSTSERILEYVERSEGFLVNEGAEQLVSELNGLEAYWFDRERILTHFIRHSQLDNINMSMSRLSALAAAGDYANVAAELASIRWQIGHLRESESLSANNLF